MPHFILNEDLPNLEGAEHDEAAEFESIMNELIEQGLIEVVEDVDGNVRCYPVD